MADAAMMQLMQIREEQAAKDKETVDTMVQQSQDDLQRRNDMASADPSLNLGGQHGKSQS